MEIYFAGSIRGGRGIQNVYSEMINVLKKYGHVMTEHVGDINIDGRGEIIGNREIHDRDLAWLKSADVVVAEVTMPSLGVGYELGKATDWGKSILCVYRLERNGLSAMIAGSSGLTVREYKRVADFEAIFIEFMAQQGILQERTVETS
jgi:hypothetical protein